MLDTYNTKLFSKGDSEISLPRIGDELVLIPVEGIHLIKDIGLAFNSNKENSSIITAVKEICRSENMN